MIRKFVLESLVIALRRISWLVNQGTHPISAFLWVLVSYHPWYRLFSCVPVRSPSYTWCAFSPFELMQRPNSPGLACLSFPAFTLVKQPTPLTTPSRRGTTARPFWFQTNRGFTCFSIPVWWFKIWLLNNYWKRISPFFWFHPLLVLALNLDTQHQQLVEYLTGR